jgi:radical SAM superfamily enzyme YgiQ (UPF0313 family)
LKKHGHQTKLFIDPRSFSDSEIDINFLGRFFSQQERIVNSIALYKPDLIGFSVLTDSYKWACDLAAKIKSRLPDIPIIFGGVHPSSVPEHVIKNSFVDMICVGEGEFALLDVVEGMKSGSIDYSTKNVWFKKDGEIIQNPPRPLIEDLDALPFSDDDLYYESAHAFHSELCSVMTSRGCERSCTYCYNHVFRGIYKNSKRYYRRRSVGNVIEELLERKKRRKISKIYFSDDNFINDGNWLKEFTTAYLRHINLPFGCNIHPADVDDETVDLLKRAGCVDVEMGIQTWDETIRKTMLHRFESNEQIERAIKILNKFRIRITADTILGIPGQTEDEILQQALFFNDNRTFVNNMFFLRFFPRTKITQIAMESGVLTKDDVRRKEEAQDAVSFCAGGDVFNKKLARLRLIFTLMPFLPKRVISFIIGKKLHKYFYPFPPNFSRIIAALSGRYSAYAGYVLEAKVKTFLSYMRKKILI